MDAGAVGSLLLLDSKLREPDVAPLLDAARGARTEVLLVRSDGEAGRRLAGLGGIRAVLRFPWRSGDRA